MSHPVLVFDFGPEGRVCMSIEVRYRKGQAYSILASLYRQHGADLSSPPTSATPSFAARNTVRARRRICTDSSRPPEEVRAAFLDYVGAINNLYSAPRWYHGLCTNCTTSFYRLPSSRRRCDWRVLANGTAGPGPL